MDNANGFYYTMSAKFSCSLSTNFFLYVYIYMYRYRHNDNWYITRMQLFILNWKLKTRFKFDIKSHFVTGIIPLQILIASNWNSNILLIIDAVSIATIVICHWMAFTDTSTWTCYVLYSSWICLHTKELKKAIEKWREKSIHHGGSIKSSLILILQELNYINRIFFIFYYHYNYDSDKQ